MTRTLPPELRTFIDSKVSPLIETWPLEGAFVAAARAFEGVTETGGDNKGPVVELLQKVISHPVQQSWCLDFVQGCVAYVEARFNIRCPLPPTELVAALWDQSPRELRVVEGRPGDIVLWQVPGTLHGHCGIIVGTDSLRYRTLEGNTSEAHTIERNGDGVYEKFRARGGSKSFIELGVLRPFP